MSHVRHGVPLALECAVLIFARPDVPAIELLSHLEAVDAAAGPGSPQSRRAAENANERALKL
jgi:hypothetical protein